MFAWLAPVTVKRTAGHLESGWYFATNLALASPYHAPEVVQDYRVRVVKPDRLADLQDPRALVAEKFVRLGDLAAWQD